ncbi:hypothetical protein C8Q77DRAFT_1201345 [Trametes polyzona]|nr:hypothetical protein C8Q77DRAFT_1201345 [Trametes polyzona]
MNAPSSTLSLGYTPEPGKRCVYDVPLALDANLSHTAGLDPRHAHARNEDHVYDMLRCIVGPMPFDQFMDQAMSKPHSRSSKSAVLSARNAFRSVPPAAREPEQIYQPLLDALNKRTRYKSRCPGMYFEDTARRSTHPRYPGFAKPHICCFTERNREAVQQLGRHSRSELGYAELIIQVTADPSRDPFVDPPADFTAEQRASFDFYSRRTDRTERKAIEEALGMHMGFVAEAFARQHRHAFYSIYLAGSRARLYRWDRAGCIVTEAFDIRENPERLCDFLWRFASTSDQARGHDTTVTNASPEQEIQFRDAIREHIRLQLGVEGEELEKALTQHYAPGRVAIMDVYAHRQPIVATGDVYRFLISRPVVSPVKLVGRCTWGYWAVGLVAPHIFFVKDTWRFKSDKGMEGDLLWYLNNREVRNVPVFAVHGDVPICVPRDESEAPLWQESVTAQWKRQPWVCRIARKTVSLHDQQRYRLVSDTVGYGLSTLQGTEELLHTTFDVFIAMRYALAKASLIHRDISVGNIILVRVPGERVRRGYLIDWEVSTKVNESGEAIHVGRTGTWLFTSWRILQKAESEIKHTFLDDVESLVHVVMYCALRYLPHGLDHNELLNVIASYFEEKIRVGDGPARGGETKLTNAFTLYIIRNVNFDSAPLEEWLGSMWRLQNPPRRIEGGAEYGPQWTGDHIEAFWSEFLKTYELERDNRVVNDITRPEREDYSNLSATQPTFPPRLGKRPAGASRSEDTAAPDTKRRRSMRLQGLAAAPALTTVATPTLDVGPRRSERLKAIQGHTQSGIGARIAPARKISRPCMS